MATVKLTDVKKIYDNKVVAVHEFNLEIKDKEFVVFVGPSGCGKSTTLRMIAGLEDISEGTIEIDGKVVNDLQPRDRDIAMVFQNYALYPHLTVFENMAFPLRLRRFPVEVEGEPAEGEKEPVENKEGEEDSKEKKIQYVKLSQDEIYKRVTEAAEILGITEYLTRKPRALSGGQRQRVAIGRAMVRESKVFLMDEPLSNLDAKLRNQMRAEIIMLRQKIDSTFVYVTHDQTEAMTLGDRIVIMKDGFIQQVGTPNEVFEMPDNLFVAEFIGAPKMNIIHTELVNEGGKYSVVPYGTKIPVDGYKGELLASKNVESQQILLGVRPEHIVLTAKSNPAAIPCTIQVNEMMGSELHLHVVTDQGGEQLIVRVPTIDLTPAQRAAMVSGAKVFITFEGKVMHFFNKETEISLITDNENVPVATHKDETDDVVKEEQPAKKSLFAKFRKNKGE
ncbi:MAG: ATP-binding cassette domain-containing protein [Clostridiales bacterium]|nr:ATP-binding cassette domain-containing protein [Clostridiales bacterium]